VVGAGGSTVVAGVPLPWVCAGVASVAGSAAGSTVSSTGTGFCGSTSGPLLPQAARSSSEAAAS